MSPRQVIEGMKQLPTASGAARKLATLLADPDAHSDDIVTVLSCDPALTVQLLKFCNSATSGFSEAIDSVDQAVMLLGQQQIFRLAASLSFGAALTPALPAYAILGGELWRHSLTTAFIAEQMCRKRFATDFEPSTAFTAGLLHDIGKAPLGAALGDQEAAVRQRITGAGRSRYEAEQDILGTDHAEVGGVLLQTWNFPDTLVEAVANHHRPEISPRTRLSAVVHVADVVAHLLGSAPGWEGLAVRIEPEVETVLGLDELEMSLALIDAHGLLTNIEQFLQI